MKVVWNYLEFEVGLQPNNVLTHSIYMVNMHDGASAHFSRDVRYVFSYTYHDKWIGTAGPFV